MTTSAKTLRAQQRAAIRSFVKLIAQDDNFLRRFIRACKPAAALKRKRTGRR